MKIDIGTFMFNVIVDNGGTPSWGTALGQGFDYKFDFQSQEDFLTAMLYNKVPDSSITCPLGKGGNQQANFDIVVSSVFKKIYVNNIYLHNATFAMIIVKELTGVHSGRKSLKYSNKIKYNGNYINEDCILKMMNALNINSNSAWIVTNINTINQDELHFRAYVLDYAKEIKFKTSQDRKKFILQYLASHSITKNKFAKTGVNKIFYGTPGSGKSYLVKQKYCRNNKKFIRTIFHPDYTNADFVGQIMPYKDGDNVSYKFKTGPFVDALILAYNNPSEPVTLIIEELNRGNAAAIFGELFQLLDRNRDVSSSDYLFSEYGIYNSYIIDELKHSVKVEYDFEFTEVIIPSNLSIIATMNTSDQNIYALDNAFQRRWKTEKVKNSFFKTNPIDKVTSAFLDDEKNYVSKRAFQLSKFMIPGTNNTTWLEFVNTINDCVLNPVLSVSGSEDKQIGIYFLDENELQTSMPGENLEEKKKAFAEKMLKYIWDDLAKLNPSDWFQSDCNSLDKVIEKFEKENIKVFNLDNIDFNNED